MIRQKAPKYYVPYVRHCVRYYLANRERPAFDNPVSQYNWESIDKTLSQLDTHERQILEDAYRDGLTDTAVYTVSDHYRIPHTMVWVLINKFEKEVAINRGLYHS